MVFFSLSADTNGGDLVYSHYLKANDIRLKEALQIQQMLQEHVQSSATDVTVVDLVQGNS